LTPSRRCSWPRTTRSRGSFILFIRIFIRVFMTPSSNSESHRHLGSSRWPTPAPDRRDGFRTRGGAFRACSEPSDGTRALEGSSTPSGAIKRIGRRLSSTEAASFPDMRDFTIQRVLPSPESSIAQHVMDNRRHCLAHLLHKSPRVPTASQSRADSSRTRSANSAGRRS
jgi:hypothetical protein